MARVLLATLIGAIIVFMWGFVSWAALQLYQDAFPSLPNESAVTAMLNENLPESGAYIFPGMPEHTPDMTEAEQNAVFAEWEARHERGPIGMILFHKPGAPAMAPTVLLGGFSAHLIAALLMSIILLVARQPSFFARYTIAVLMAIFAVTMTHGVNWSFFYLPNDYTLALVVDGIIAWALAGFVIALIVKPMAKPTAAE